MMAAVKAFNGSLSVLVIVVLLITASCSNVPKLHIKLFHRNVPQEFRGFDRVVAYGPVEYRGIDLYDSFPCVGAYELHKATVSAGTNGADKDVSATYRIRSSLFNETGESFVCMTAEERFGPWPVSLGSDLEYPFKVQFIYTDTEGKTRGTIYECADKGDCART